VLVAVPVPRSHAYSRFDLKALRIARLCESAIAILAHNDAYFGQKRNACDRAMISWSETRTHGFLETFHCQYDTGTPISTPIELIALMLRANSQFDSANTTVDGIFE
jgi:hypothetical protein